MTNADTPIIKFKKGDLVVIKEESKAHYERLSSHSKLLGAVLEIEMEGWVKDVVENKFIVFYHFKGMTKNVAVREDALRFACKLNRDAKK